MKFLILEASIAFRYLRAKKHETFISIISVLSLLGITIGVGALVVVMSVMNGYRIELTQKLKGFNSDIIVTGENDKLGNYKNTLNKVKNISKVKKIIPVINAQSLILNKNKAVGVMVKGLKKLDMPSYSFLLGSARSIKRPNGIILGNMLARSIGAHIGDTVKLVSPKFESTMFGDVPVMKEFYVEALFRSGLSEYDGMYVIMELGAAQKLFDMKAGISRLEIFLNPMTDSTRLSDEISRTLSYQHQVLDWQMMDHNIFNALKTERVVMFIILAFIIVVAAFNIISSLVMLVTDKTKEIAILRTIGFSRSAIMRIFLICGMALGIIGTFLGVCFGTLFASHINEIKEFLSSISGVTLFDPIIYYLDVLPAKIDKKDIVHITTLALVLSFISALYPAYKASKLSPAQGLKND